MASKGTQNSKPDFIDADGKELDVNQSTGELSTRANLFSTEELRGIQSFADVEALFKAHEVTVVEAAEEIGDGFVLTDNKDMFLDREIMLLQWNFAKGDFGDDSYFVAVRLVCQEANGSLGKYIITDGGQGICKQLKEYTDRTGAKGGMLVKGGLNKSTYSNEFTSDGVTHYLNLNK